MYIYIYICICASTYVHTYTYVCLLALIFLKLHPSSHPEACEPEERVPMQLLRAPLKEGVRVEAVRVVAGVP